MSILFFQKKHYLKNVVWQDSVYYDPMSYISPTGIKIVRSSTPAFVRGKKQAGGIWDFIHYIFNNSEHLNIQECLKIVKELRKEFEGTFNIQSFDKQGNPDTHYVLWLENKVLQSLELLIEASRSNKME